MSVSLRLTRVGKKKQPSYRIVAVDKRKARDGKYIEKLGIFNPLKSEPNVIISKELVFKWFRVGAEPSQTVKQILSKQGLLAEWTQLKNSTTSAPKKKKARKSRYHPMAEKLKLRTELEKKQALSKAYEAKKRKEKAAVVDKTDVKSSSGGAEGKTQDSATSAEKSSSGGAEGKTQASAASAEKSSSGGAEGKAQDSATSTEKSSSGGAEGKNQASATSTEKSSSGGAEGKNQASATSTEKSSSGGAASKTEGSPASAEKSSSGGAEGKNQDSATSAEKSSSGGAASKTEGSPASAEKSSSDEVENKADPSSAQS